MLNYAYACIHGDDWPWCAYEYEERKIFIFLCSSPGGAHIYAPYAHPVSAFVWNQTLQFSQSKRIMATLYLPRSNNKKLLVECISETKSKWSQIELRTETGDTTL